jgi:hypothetical protein
MTRRNFHPRKPKKPTAAEHEMANNVAALVVAAAGKLLRDRYGWTAEEATAFIDALPAAVNDMAGNINAVFNEPRAGRGRLDRAAPPEAS